MSDDPNIPTMAGAGGEVALAGAASQAQHSRIIPLAPNVGNCILCGQHIKLVGGATTCPTCAAWRRWYSARRIAARALREAQGGNSGRQ